MIQVLSVVGFVVGWWLAQRSTFGLPRVSPFATIADPTEPTAAEITAGSAL